MDGIVVIGEGEKDEAPMLFNGERVGDGTGPECDVAVDPIDGTRLTALGMGNALSVLAVSPRGSMFDPSAVFYMEKLATGPDAADVVDIRLPVAENVRRVAKAKRESPSDVTVVILDRPRHAAMVEEVRSTGARIVFITDGDVAGAIMAAREGTGLDLLVGIGGTPEGIIAACAIKTLGGVIQGRLWPADDDERQKAIDAGHDLDRVLVTDELVRGEDVFFVATGITDGEMLKGVRYGGGGTVRTHSIVMRSRSGTIRRGRERAPAGQAEGLLRDRLRARALGTGADHLADGVDHAARLVPLDLVPGPVDGLHPSQRRELGPLLLTTGPGRVERGSHPRPKVAVVADASGQHDDRHRTEHRERRGRGERRPGREVLGVVPRREQPLEVGPKRSRPAGRSSRDQPQRRVQVSGRGGVHQHQAGEIVVMLLGPGRRDDAADVLRDQHDRPPEPEGGHHGVQLVCQVVDGLPPGRGGAVPDPEAVVRADPGVRAEALLHLVPRGQRGVVAGHEQHGRVLRAAGAPGRHPVTVDRDRLDGREGRQLRATSPGSGGLVATHQAAAGRGEHQGYQCR